ncbi:GNAT family N-acetyltransferase [Nonomuraea basaltis]|uniref:GNAT family N-acetyltransferase n=1 Tax=Nonomuraea basaltis TaxID=2495887 RepID=UPI00110C4449|nr:GNAT family N-acetyltransferase [Nonomuraea basaltis]TMR97680.1 GNAT family N-acetyltransferase [Nonomuraea basaltis]
MKASVMLNAAATPASPALVLRPWDAEDVAAVVAAYRDPVLRRWTSSRVENEVEGLRWVRAQQRGWATGTRFSFAVLEAHPRPAFRQVLGNMVLRDVAPGKSSAEVGYWTAAHARGRGVAAGALEAVTQWAFDTFGADGLERLELLHEVDNTASCRVAQKSRYELDVVLPAAPPTYPLDGHLHVRARA